MSKNFLRRGVNEYKTDKELRALYMDLSTDELYRLHVMVNNRLNWINGDE
tara:strand:+ start:307 stop:456 length:150 start_codon:yes stop_codon:yes gene_type:complete